MRENPQPSRLMSWDCDRYATFQCHAQSHVQDRKSTRLNSSHLGISYAVFCLKKKKKNCEEGHTGKIRLARIASRENRTRQGGTKSHVRQDHRLRKATPTQESPDRDTASAQNT